MPVPKVIPFPQKTKQGAWLTEGGPLAIILFASNPLFPMGIIQYKPPGIVGSKSLDIETQEDVIEVDDPINGRRFIGVKMKVPGTSIEFTDGDFSAEYDPDMYLKAPPFINCPGDSYTAYLPNGGYVIGWGHVEELQTDEFSKGKVPMLKGKYVSTCRDPNTGFIQVPIYVKPNARASRGQGV